MIGTKFWKGLEVPVSEARCAQRPRMAVVHLSFVALLSEASAASQSVISSAIWCAIQFDRRSSSSAFRAAMSLRPRPRPRLRIGSDTGGLFAFLEEDDLLG